MIEVNKLKGKEEALNIGVLSWEYISSFEFT